jgi:molecular chaperone DnaK (HSP70)
MGKIIGIDLGTTNSCVASWKANTEVIGNSRRGDALVVISDAVRSGRRARGGSRHQRKEHDLRRRD